MTIFKIIWRISDQNIHQHEPINAPVFKIFSEDLLNPVMYAHLLLFEKKITIQKGQLFPIFKRSS